MKIRHDRIYDVNIKRLALLVLPTWLRKPLCGALIYAGVSPLGRLLQQLRAYRQETSYRLEHNGQVCKLRGLLNDMFDPELRRIRIEEMGDTVAPQSIYMRATGRQVLIGDGRGHVVNRRGFGGANGYDFWVSLPEAIRGTVDERRLRAAVNMFKLASKRYDIVYH